MRRMMLGALGALLFVPVALSAQPPRRQGPGPQMLADRPNLARALIDNRAALELGDDQVARLETIARETEARRTELRALREQFDPAAELTEEERGRMRDALRTAAEGERQSLEGIRAVLTLEQSDRLRRLSAALGSLAGGRGGPGMRAGRSGGPQGFAPQTRRDLERRGMRQFRRPGRTRAPSGS